MSQSNVSHLPNVRAYVDGGRPRQDFGANAANQANDGARKRFVAKGHDAQLQEAQLTSAPVQLTCVSGIVVKGIISRRDKYTVTLRHSEQTDNAEAGDHEIFYKHAIESVLIKKAA